MTSGAVAMIAMPPPFACICAISAVRRSAYVFISISCGFLLFSVLLSFLLLLFMQRRIQLHQPFRCADIIPVTAKQLATDLTKRCIFTQQRRELGRVAIGNGIEHRWSVHTDTRKSQAWHTFVGEDRKRVW